MWAKFRRLGDGDIDELQRQADEANAEVSEGGRPFPMGRREMQRARARADAEAVAAMHVRAQLADDRVGQPAPLHRALEAHGRTLAAVAAAAPSGALAARPSADALAVIKRALRTSSDSERREEKARTSSKPTLPNQTRIPTDVFLGVVYIGALVFVVFRFGLHSVGGSG
jgi:hypothetical protein